MRKFIVNLAAGVFLSSCVSSRGDSPGDELAKKHQEIVDETEEGFSKAGDGIQETSEDVGNQFKEIAKELMDTVNSFKENTLGLSLVHDSKHQRLLSEMNEIQHMSIEDMAKNLKADNPQDTWFFQILNKAKQMIQEEEEKGLAGADEATRELVIRLNILENKLDNLREEAGLKSITDED